MGYPERVTRARPQLVALALAMALSSSLNCQQPPEDPLELGLLAELALERGSGSGRAHAGTWILDLEAHECDCPPIEVDEISADICALSRSAGLSAEIQEGGGALALLLGVNGELGLVSGAIESDASFDLAGRHDAMTILGPLVIHRRLIGSFGSTDQAEGWVGHRFIAEIAGERIDCRSTGEFTATRP